MLVRQGDLPNALAAYKAALAIRERLATADPGNVKWQRDLSTAHSNIGNVLLAQGNLSNALAAYKGSLVIAERLATADPGDAGLQDDLSDVHDEIAEVLVGQEPFLRARRLQDLPSHQRTPRHRRPRKRRVATQLVGLA